MSQQGYIGRNPGDGRTIVNRQTSHVTTGVQTSFTMTTGYEIGYLDVYLNGIKQTETLDYTASDGSTINFSLSYPPVNGDVLEFVAFETLNITNIKSARRNFSVGQDLDVSGKVTIGSSLTVASDLVVNGTFTTINTEILDVEDKTVGIASTSSPSNTTADGAGIVIYGGSDGDKSLTWNSTKSNFVLVGGGVSIGTGVTISTPAANVLAFSVNSAEKARFNNFGAFTVGYEGEAWHESTYVGVLQAGSGAWIGQTPGASARAEWVNNAYYDSVNTRWEYIAADEANRIVLENGELKLQSADAGSADGAITWNEKLKMTVGGDFKIGAPTGIGITISSSGNVDSIGIVTASSFVGNGANLTSLNASNIGSGTVPTARLGSGTASSSTFLRGDSTFATVTTTTINNNANNRIITGSGTADTLEAEATLTFDGSTLVVTPTSSDARVTILGSEGNDARLSLISDDGDDHIDQYNLRVAASNNRFYIDQFESGAFQERFTIANGGNIGIGGDQWAKLVVTSSSTNTSLTGHNYLASQFGMSLDNSSNTTGSFSAYTSRVKNASGTQQSASLAFKSTSSGYTPEIHLTQRTGAGVQASRLTINQSGNATFSGVTTATQFAATTINNDRKNLLINGEMKVNQRVGSSGLTYFNPVTGSIYTLDRWKVMNGSSFDTDSAHITKSTQSPDGFSSSMKWDIGNTETPSSNQNCGIEQKIEGLNLQHLAYGTSSAKTMTLSFYVYSNKTGTYNVHIMQEDGTKYQMHEYTISSQNTWEKKTIRIVGNTANAINDDNTTGLRIIWVLTVGSGDTVAATSTWASGGDLAGTSNQVNLWDNGNNYWYLTGCQLELGEVATAYEHVPLSEELERCQRYYEKSYNLATRPGDVDNDGSVMFLSNRNNGTAHTMLRFATRKRANPTVTAYDPTQANTTGMRDLDASQTYNYTMNRMGEMGCTAYPTGNLALGQFIQFHYTAESEL